MAAKRGLGQLQSDVDDEEEVELRRLEGAGGAGPVSRDDEGSDAEEVQVAPRAAARPSCPRLAVAVSRIVLSPRQLLLLLLLLLSMSLLVLQHAASRAERQAARHRARMDFASFVQGMPEAEFRRYYRISRNSFDTLAEDIRPVQRVLKKQRTSAHRVQGDFVEYELRLSMALRYAAGGSYLDVMYLHGARAILKRTRAPVLSVCARAQPAAARRCEQDHVLRVALADRRGDR
jgi:hypothetical protein